MDEHHVSKLVDSSVTTGRLAGRFAHPQLHQRAGVLMSGRVIQVQHDGTRQPIEQRRSRASIEREVTTQQAGDRFGQIRSVFDRSVDLRVGRPGLGTR